MKRIAVIGAKGQLGSRLCEILGDAAIPITRVDMQLTSDASIEQCLGNMKPEYIINTAAYTNVEKAEDEPELAMQINAHAPQIMAQWAAKHKVGLLHISTDYVFDGTKDAPYTEQDDTCALNAYGKSKAAGEKAVLDAKPDACILRVSWLYDARGRNFFTTIADKLLGDAPLRIVSDQYGTPCFAPDIASMIGTLVQQNIPSGLVHMVHTGYASWYEFSIAIKSTMQAQMERQLADIIPITTAEYQTRAVRPKDSRLDASKLYSTHQLRLPLWNDALVRAMKERYAD